MQAMDFFVYILKSQVMEEENSSVPEKKVKNFSLCLNKKVYNCNHYGLVCFGEIPAWLQIWRGRGIPDHTNSHRAAADAETQWQIT